MKRLTLETDIRKAIEHKEFSVHYQPIVDLKNLQLIGFEALARWLNPQKGLIYPDEFIPISEETGLIASIDCLVMHQACQQISHWEKGIGNGRIFGISINVSAQTLRRATLLEDVEAFLSETSLTGDKITIEITESMLIDDIDRTIDLLAKLASKEISISIDDFGTGYSCLNYLHRLPVHSLKVDRSFVSQMQTNNKNYQMINTILALSKKLGITVVAEGIETKEQLQYLQELGCEYGQGYLFSKPLSAEAATEALITKGFNLID